MAVQAHYPTDASSPDRAWNDVFPELQVVQDHSHLISNLLGGQWILNDGAMFRDPQSELTCNASGLRKRSRDHPTPTLLSQPTGQTQQAPCQFPYANRVTSPASTSLQQLSHDQSRMYGSLGTSTTGRPAVSQDLVSQLYCESVEIDALIRLQTERLRSGLEEARKRHCTSLLSVLEQQVVNRLKLKEAELEGANQRNAELEEKVRQMSAESQKWFNVAKNSEAVVSSLRTNLEQVLLQNTAPPAKEGYSDSNGIPLPADDAQSCCFQGEDREREVNQIREEAEGESVRRESEELRCRLMCRVCREREVCVLLLPCRHLCLCKACESKLDECPVCHTTKNVSLQISMS